MLVMQVATQGQPGPLYGPLEVSTCFVCHKEYGSWPKSLAGHTLTQMLTENLSDDMVPDQWLTVLGSTIRCCGMPVQP